MEGCAQNTKYSKWSRFANPEKTNLLWHLVMCISKHSHSDIQVIRITGWSGIEKTEVMLMVFFRLFFTIVHVDPSFVHPRLKSQMTDKHSLHFTTLFKMFAILDVQRLPIYELSFCFKSKSEANWQSLGIFWACASERRWMKVNVQSRTKWTLYTLRPNIDNVHTLTSFYTLCPEMVARSNNTVCFRATSLQSIPSVLKPMIKQAKIIQIRIIET